jgi:hypothetical protein
MQNCIQIGKAKLCLRERKKIGFVWYSTVNGGRESDDRTMHQSSQSEAAPNRIRGNWLCSVFIGVHLRSSVANSVFPEVFDYGNGTVSQKGMPSWI